MTAEYEKVDVTQEVTDDTFIDEVEKNSDEEVWNEVKVKGLNIHRRSYHVSAMYKQHLYIYGGDEFNQGILSDF